MMLSKQIPSIVIASLIVTMIYSTEGYSAEERFDMQVREDIFAGFDGDAEALGRGLARCQATLDKDPDHAEALVWRGAVRMFQSGNEFAAGNTRGGMGLWADGLQDLNRGKQLAPNNIAVLIPRAAVLVNAGRNAPTIMGRPLLEAVREDFEEIYERQKNHLGEIGEHPLGELRMGLADVYRMLGQPDESAIQLRRVSEELPGTQYATRAEQWLTAKPDAKLAHNCIGCHNE